MLPFCRQDCVQKPMHGQGGTKAVEVRDLIQMVPSISGRGCFYGTREPSYEKVSTADVSSQIRNLTVDMAR